MIRREGGRCKVNLNWKSRWFPGIWLKHVTSVEKDWFRLLTSDFLFGWSREEVTDFVPEWVAGGGALSEIHHSWAISCPSSEGVSKSSFAEINFGTVSKGNLEK